MKNYNSSNITDVQMFPTMMMNPWNSLLSKEHANLFEDYQNVTRQVSYVCT